MTPEESFSILGLELPPAPEPAGLYRPVVVVGAVALTSGHAPLRTDGSRIVGRVGQDCTLEEGRAAARQAGLAILSSLRASLGSLDRVKRVVRIFGMVNSTVDFGQHPAVIDGCSELFAQVWGGDAGVGVRCAAGVKSLPGGIVVEIEAEFLLEGKS